ncbi:MAG: metallophosphoesterase [Dysosmobacter sp.]|nr:metallophosphoesterase [Dysosmobacter sp.]
MLSDPHRRYGKYRSMLEKIRFKSTDILYVLGDIIDRGPDGVEILRDMMGRPNVIPLLGNHEFTAAMCLPWLLSEVTEQNLDSLDMGQFAALQEWIANGGGPTLRALKRLGREEQENIQNMDVYIETEI